MDARADAWSAFLAGADQAQEGVIVKQYDDGSVYEGTLKDGRQDGVDTYRLPNGYEYSVDWVAGEIRAYTRTDSTGSKLHVSLLL